MGVQWNGCAFRNTPTHTSQSFSKLTHAAACNFQNRFSVCLDSLFCIECRFACLTEMSLLAGLIDKIEGLILDRVEPNVLKPHLDSLREYVAPLEREAQPGARRTRLKELNEEVKRLRSELSNTQQNSRVRIESLESELKTAQQKPQADVERVRAEAKAQIEGLKTQLAALKLENDTIREESFLLRQVKIVNVEEKRTKSDTLSQIEEQVLRVIVDNEPLTVTELAEAMHEFEGGASAINALRSAKFIELRLVVTAAAARTDPRWFLSAKGVRYAERRKIE